MDDEIVEVSPTGGLNSRIEGRWDLLEYRALARLVAVLDYGAKKYGDENWRLDPPELHLKHALGHIFRYLEARRLNGRQPVPHQPGDDDLGHAFCRLMFAIATEEDGEERG
jgi:hypothetical protein